MRTSRLNVDRSVAWLCAAFVTVSAFGQLTWMPQAGGYSGDWDATTPNWTANGTDPVTYSGTQAIFAGTDGIHTVTLKKSFADQTSLLFSNGTYTLTAPSAVTNKNTSNALTFTAVAGKTVSLGSGVVFQSIKSSSPHYTFLGGGTFKLEAGATLNSDHNNGIIQVGKSTSATSADADKGFLEVNGGTITARRRLAISIGSLTVASGNVLIAQSSATESAFPIGLGVDYDCGYADLNLTGGLLKITTQGGTGIVIGGTFKNGGTINLDGGTLQTVSIVQGGGNNSVRKRIVNLNGSVIRIDSGATQTHIDDFIKNFTGTGVGLYLLENGITFDTSMVSNATDQIVKILSPIQSPANGATGGTLVKAGANTLRLSATNRYNGATLVQGGTLQLGVALAVTNTPSLLVQNGATLDLSLATGFTLSLGRPQTLGGNGTVNGALDFAAGSHLSFSLNASPAGSDTLTFVNSGILAFGELPVDFAASPTLKSGRYPIVRCGAGVTSFSGTLTVGAGLGSYPHASIEQVSNGYDLLVPSAGTLIMVN